SEEIDPRVIRCRPTIPSPILLSPKGNLRLRAGPVIFAVILAQFVAIRLQEDIECVPSCPCCRLRSRFPLQHTQPESRWRRNCCRPEPFTFKWGSLSRLKRTTIEARRRHISNL